MEKIAFGSEVDHSEFFFRMVVIFNNFNLEFFLWENVHISAEALQAS